MATEKKPAPSRGKQFTGLDSTGGLVGQLDDLSASRHLGTASDEDLVTDAISAALVLAGVAFAHDCIRDSPSDAEDRCQHPRHMEDREKLARALEPITSEIRAAGFGGSGNWAARRVLMQAFSLPAGTPLTATGLGGESPGRREAARAGLAELERCGWVRKTGYGTWVRPEAKRRKGER